MTDALCQHIGKICHVYLDDIIIWSQTIEEHTWNCELILDALQKASIYCNQAKSNLCHQIDFSWTHYLGGQYKTQPLQN